MADDDHTMFPKPTRRPKRKVKFNREQARVRIGYERAYRRKARPGYLMNLAREQGRLTLADDEIEGDDLREKLSSLPYAMHPLCEVRAPGTECEARGGKVATSIHHKKGRMKQKHAPHLLTDDRFFCATCDDCHEHIERNRNWARENGWILRRN